MRGFVDYEVGDLVEWRTGATFEPNTWYLYRTDDPYANPDHVSAKYGISRPKGYFLVLEFKQINYFSVAKVLSVASGEIGYRVDYHFVKVID